MTTILFLINCGRVIRVLLLEGKMAIQEEWIFSIHSIPWSKIFHTLNYVWFKKEQSHTKMRFLWKKI